MIEVIKFTGILYKLWSKLSLEWFKSIYFRLCLPLHTVLIKNYDNRFTTYLDIYTYETEQQHGYVVKNVLRLMSYLKCSQSDIFCMIPYTE